MSLIQSTRDVGRPVAHLAQLINTPANEIAVSILSGMELVGKRSGVLDMDSLQTLFRPCNSRKGAK